MTRKAAKLMLVAAADFRLVRAQAVLLPVALGRQALRSLLAGAARLARG